MKRFAIFALLLSCTFAYTQPLGTLNANMHIDQFGYPTQTKKIAVLSNPQTGFNAAEAYTPGVMIEVRDWTTNQMVLSAAPMAWNQGNTHDQSGDKVWWFDFSVLQQPGSYYLYDPSNSTRSYRFEIDDHVYDNVLKVALKVFYYQRAGFAKTAPYAGAWTDGASHVGPLQDLDCRLITNPSQSTSKNLSGGWYDAGDYNKYVNFTYHPMLHLLLAYEQYPEVWTDNFGIPESGNGIPDLLDEVKYELDWLLKMQQANGSVLSVVGVQNFASASPPSADVAQRFYGPATTSATFTASAIFALAAIEYRSLADAAMQAYANTLQTAAISAYNWAVANPGVTYYNSGSIAAGEQEVDDYTRSMRRLGAACFLYALTGDATYKTYFESNYNQAHLLQWSYAYPFEGPEQQALLYYTKQAGTSNAVVSAIKNTYENSLRSNNTDNLPAYLNHTDAYRAFLSNNNYTWGSNRTKADQAIMLLAMNEYGLNAANATNYKDAAFAYLSYMHGVNPFNLCYLTNMASWGAENSVPEVYHSWFANGTPFDNVNTSPIGPAPGYLAGGPNPSYQPDPACNCIISPPQNQPIQKSFKAWNTSWPENSWELTEPGIYYQAVYLRLLAQYSLYNTATDTKVPNSQENNIIVFPNPAKSQVTVQVPPTLVGARFLLSDTSDHLLMTGIVAAEKTELDLTPLPAGVYILLINDTVVKVVKGE